MYIDLHTHSTLSDGKFPAEALIREAAAAGITVLSITDHDKLPSDFSDLSIFAASLGVTLIPGTEVSCYFTAPDGKQHLIHLVALGFDPEDAPFRAFLAGNDPDRRPYLEGMLQKLRENGIDLGALEEICPGEGIQYYGKKHLAKELLARGYVQSMEEAYDRYLGAFGQRLAYVPKALPYCTTEEALTRIHAAGGTAVLAHLYYYGLSEEDNHALLSAFRAQGGGAMETEYAPYSRQQRDALAELAKQYRLLPSCASDYHGQNERETLQNRFPVSLCQPLLEKIGIL